MTLPLPQWLQSFFAPVRHCPHQGAITLAYRPDIDGLRALAVLCVVAFHAFPHTLRGGFIGVDIFFVISGYLISSIIVQDLEKGTFSIVNFYSRRIRRIFPALILVLLSVMAFGWFALLPDEYMALGKHVFGGSVFVSNFVLWQEAGYFDVASQLKPLLHLWSLGIEEQFYIFFPLILWLCAKKHFRIPTIIAALCVLSFLDNMYLFRKAPVVDFYSPLARVWELMAGAALSTALRYQVVQRAYIRVDAVCGRWLMEGPVPNDGRSLSLILASAGVLLVGMGLLLSRQGDAYPGWKALFPVMGAVCLLAAGPANGISKHIFSNRFAVFIGLISYPLYLWHWPLLSYARIIIGGLDSSTRLLRVGLVVLALVLASLTYFIVERPVRFEKRKPIRCAVMLGCLMIMLGTTGLAFNRSGGLPERDTIKQHALVGEQLKPPVYVDDAGLAYVGDKGILYCRYVDAQASETVAVIGDSHAMSAFHGIAKLGVRGKSYNTVLLGWMIPGVAIWLPERGNDQYQILDFLLQKIEIKKVFFITRGPWYLTGIHNYPRGLRAKNTIIGEKVFQEELQNIVDKLVAVGKKVYIPIEDPELLADPRDYAWRPFRKAKTIVSFPKVTKADVLKRQKEYRDILTNIKNATVIDTVDYFCPKGECFAFTKDGLPTRYDDDHLSFIGSEMLANDVLKPYLLEELP